MTTPLTIDCEIHFERRGRGYRKVLERGPRPLPVPSAGQIPTVARWMALAIRVEGLLRDGAVANYAEVARLGHVTRARVSQIAGLVNLAPDIQEAILHLPPTMEGRDPIILADLLPIAGMLDWEEQRKQWRERIGITTTH